MTVTLPPIRWQPSPNQSDRRTDVRLVVVHRPVGSYAGSISALCDPKHEASAHVILREDGREATQMVGWDRKAWACVAFNSPSENIETPDWIWTHDAITPPLMDVMRVCARIVAFRLHVRKLPSHYVSGALVLNGEGFTRHFDLGRAGGGHSDPTTDPHRWQMFCELVDVETQRGGFRKTWGKN